MSEYVYLGLLTDVLSGDFKDDRTGTGTYSQFGRQIRFDLNEGFPLLTTKKMATKSILWELKWFLNGDTNVKFLQDHGVKIWNEWADKNGELGPVYGWSWRHWGAIPDRIPQPKPKLREGCNPTYVGVADGTGSYKHLLEKTWEGMIQRCYGVNDIGYDLYGDRGVHVCNEWLEFKKFADDATRLPGWEGKLDFPRSYNLDKDGLGDGFLYSPNTCQWVTPQQNMYLKATKVYRVRRVSDGEEFEFVNPTKFCDEHDLEGKNFSDLWTGKKNAKVRSGYTLVSVKSLKDHEFDQISWLVNEIKTNPNSRRLIVSAWNVSEIDQMALPPCHCLFQFFVNNGKLSCQLYQRSCDLFLGVPFNIASYAMLTHLVAKECGLKVGEFIHTFGDVHIYKNHVQQVLEQLNREPLGFPAVNLDNAGSLFDFNPDGVVFEGYRSHPAIKGPIAV